MTVRHYRQEKWRQVLGSR